MAPLFLKVSGTSCFNTFSDLQNDEDLLRSWRVCTKVKDSLENGSRLENLSWRLWFLHTKCNNNKTNNKHKGFEKISRRAVSNIKNSTLKKHTKTSKVKKESTQKTIQPNLTTNTNTTIEQPQQPYYAPEYYNYQSFQPPSTSTVNNNNVNHEVKMDFFGQNNATLVYGGNELLPRTIILVIISNIILLFIIVI
jgi:hypothetical protein